MNDFNILKYMLLFTIFFLLRDFIRHIVQFIYWKFVDFSRFIKNPKRPLHLYGIWLYCGLYGGGKTMALSHYLSEMRKRYGDRVYISTNYGFKGEDFPLLSWKELLTEYDRPVIFGYDEIQNEFNSRDYKNFPYELVRLLTQNRKGHGKQIVGTAQRFCRVDKVIRELCTHVIECHTLLGRWTFLKKYDSEDYEEMLHQVDVVKKHKVPCWRSSFVQSDTLRESYDSFQMLESAKTKEYVTAAEKLGLENAQKTEEL